MFCFTQRSICFSEIISASSPRNIFLARSTGGHVPPGVSAKIATGNCLWVFLTSSIAHVVDQMRLKFFANERCHRNAVFGLLSFNGLNLSVPSGLPNVNRGRVEIQILDAEAENLRGT